jgi:hypothetical protein
MLNWCFAIYNKLCINKIEPMNLNCRCGELIHDITDYQENKAHFIPDQSWESMHESIADGNSSWNAASKVRRVMYQCHNCSRLYVQDQSGNFISFAPEGNGQFGILKNA